ncbi:DUF4384 domain-containing protein [Thermodesulfobacteriota bacterium]
MRNEIAALQNGRFIIPFLIFLSLIFPQIVFSQDLRGVNVVPDNEKRSCIKAADGYAYLSEDMTLSDTRAAAFADAKRKALEMAKTYVSSKTKVEDFVTKYDMIWSESEGAVSVLEQKDHGIEDNTRYHVWIKAEVEYTFKPKGPQVTQDPAMDEYAPLTVKVWTSKKMYKDGESIKIHIRGNRDFYARIVDIISSGDIIQLLPNDYRNTNFFKGGVVYNIPDEDDRFALKVSPPYGEDQIVVYASESPLGEVDMEPIGQGLNMYRGSRKTLGAKTRGIAVVSDGKNVDSGAEFYEATWSLKTEK